jgi:hypothetical protein
VRSCWSEFLAGDPVLKRRRGEGDVWRCRFCARDHDSQASARRCAAECKEKHLALHDLEVSETDDGSAAAGGPKGRPLRAATRAYVPLRAVPVARTLKSKSRSSPEEAEASTSVTTESAAEATTASSAKPVSTAKATEGAAPAPTKAEAGAAKPAKKKKHDGSFYRDGARYVCSECNEKYFTRVEVQACFDKHAVPAAS